MVDTQSCSGRFLLLGLWSLWATRLRVVHTSTGLFFFVDQRFAVEPRASWVDIAELEVSEANEPFAIFRFGDPYRFTYEHLAYKDHLAAPLDLAVRTDRRTAQSSP